MLRNDESKEERQATLDKDFLSEVLISYVPDWNPDLVQIDFEKCDKLLAEGANINVKFGKHAMNDIDACSFCGPNDTPLTHAVNRNHTKLTQYLLQHGADTELLNGTDETALIKACGNFNDAHASKIIQSLLEHGANPNAINHRNFTAMHMIFFHLREWLVDSQRKPAAHAAKLLLDAGFVGDLEEIAKRVCTEGEDEKIVKAFKQICAGVNMAARLEANKKEYDQLKRYIDENHIQSGKGLSSKIKNILRDQEALKTLELENTKKQQKSAAKQLAKAVEKIEHIHTILEKTAGTMGDEKATIYDPALPFHRQAARLVGSGGTANLLGIPYTLETVYFKAVMINGNEYYISMNKKTEIGSDNGVYLYNKLSFEVIDVAAKKIFSDIDPKDIDSMLRGLHDQSKELSYQCKQLNR